MYFTISITEDGHQIRSFDTEAELVAEINELTSEDIREDCRAEFVTEIPTWSSSENDVLIIKGEIIVPEPVEVVRRWTL